MRSIKGYQSDQPVGSERSTLARVGLRPRKEPTTIDGVTYKVAENFSERCGAFHLVHHCYSERGLSTPNGWGLRINARQLLPDSAVFIASENGRVVSTLSIVQSRGMGLLLEREFGPEVDSLRNDGATLAEVTSLASLTMASGRKKGFDVLLNLFRLVYAFSEFNGIDRLLIAVHPRHARFYESALGFQAIGPQRAYRGVLGQPAVACVHDRKRFQSGSCRLKEKLVDSRFESWELTSQPIPPAELEYFAAAWHSLHFVSRAA